MPQDLIIIKNNHLSQEVWRYGGRCLFESEHGVLVEAFFNRSDLEFNGILLKEGDRFLELYLYDRYFNIYEIYDRDSNLRKAWYCNVTRPVRLQDNQILYDDLALDLLVYPDGKQLVLDEDEFQDLPLEKNERQAARQGLEQLQQLFRLYQPLNVRELV